VVYGLRGEGQEMVLQCVRQVSGALTSWPGRPCPTAAANLFFRTGDAPVLYIRDLLDRVAVDRWREVEVEGS
jgi:hypothetical protein